MVERTQLDERTGHSANSTRSRNHCGLGCAVMFAVEFYFAWAKPNQLNTIQIRYVTKNVTGDRVAEAALAEPRSRAWRLPPPARTQQSRNPS